MWNHDGKEIAFEQIELGTPQLQENGKGSAQIKEKGEFALIKGEDFCYRFNLHYGWLEMRAMPKRNMYHMSSPRNTEATIIPNT